MKNILTSHFMTKFSAPLICLSFIFFPPCEIANPKKKTFHNNTERRECILSNGPLLFSNKANPSQHLPPPHTHSLSSLFSFSSTHHFPYLSSPFAPCHSPSPSRFLYFPKSALRLRPALMSSSPRRKAFTRTAARRVARRVVMVGIYCER